MKVEQTPTGGIRFTELSGWQWAIAVLLLTGIAIGGLLVGGANGWQAGLVGGIGAATIGVASAARRNRGDDADPSRSSGNRGLWLWAAAVLVLGASAVILLAS